ncbi:hypothetical protein BJY00DRAFT_285313 [Aspergillus carlsbadensis]|nr:hypothetical protein BJY00DRAFT_285313 [Aspergillus carlsbadensis]
MADTTTRAILPSPFTPSTSTTLYFLGCGTGKGAGERAGREESRPPSSTPNGLVVIREWCLSPGVCMPTFAEHEPAVWRGAPFASLRQAFQAAHSPSGRAIPSADRDKLEILHELYFSMDEAELDAIEARYSPGEDADFDLGEELQDDEDDEDHERPRKRVKVDHASFDFLNRRWAYAPNGGIGSSNNHVAAPYARSALV